MEEITFTLNDFVDVMRRRKWWFILPSTFVLLASLLVALVLPPVYMSTAKILIEEQEIPTDYVRATVTSYAEQRVEAIKQRVMSSVRLLDIAKSLSLYSDHLSGKTPEEIVSTMRKDIKLETISTDVVNERTGRESAVTIAFTLTFEGKQPEKVQQVTSLLSSLFLEENLQIRKRQTQETADFLQNEMEKIEKDLESIEANVLSFKEKHINELPSMLQVNIQSMQGIELKKERLKEELLSKKERDEYLRSELAGIPEASKDIVEKKRLEELEAQLVNLKTHFTDEYPDVVKTKSEIAELKRKALLSSPVGSEKSTNIDNPAYVTLNAQLSSTKSEINSLQRQIQELTQKEDEYRRRIEATLRIEEEYKSLISMRDNTQAKYNDLMKKFMEAKVSHGLEEEQKGERFTLIEPANYPEKPYKPNRLVIVVLGVVVSFGLGVAALSMREYTDTAIRDADMLARSTAFPVLGSIPEIVTREDAAREKRKRVVIATILLLLLVSVVVLLQQLSFDMGMIWTKVMQGLL